MNFCARLFLVSTSCVALASLALATSQPDYEASSADFKRLDALQRVFVETQAHNDQFGAAFWRASKRLADERGPAIIDAVMVLSRKWQNEEGLIYVPLVALLPRDKALEVLHRYQHSKRESDKVYADEFITEFDMDDTKAAVEKYSA